MTARKTRPVKPVRRRSEFDRGVIVGMALACSTIQDAYDNPVAVAYALAAAGLDRRKLKAAGVAEYDLKILRPVFAENSLKRRVTPAPQRRRKS